MRQLNKYIIKLTYKISGSIYVNDYHRYVLSIKRYAARHNIAIISENVQIQCDSSDESADDNPETELSDVTDDDTATNKPNKYKSSRDAFSDDDTATNNINRHVTNSINTFSGVNRYAAGSRDAFSDEDTAVGGVNRHVTNSINTFSDEDTAAGGVNRYGDDEEATGDFESVGGFEEVENDKQTDDIVLPPAPPAINYIIVSIRETSDATYKLSSYNGGLFDRPDYNIYIYSKLRINGLPQGVGMLCDKRINIYKKYKTKQISEVKYRPVERTYDFSFILDNFPVFLSIDQLNNCKYTYVVGKFINEVKFIGTDLEDNVTPHVLYPTRSVSWLLNRRVNVNRLFSNYMIDRLELHSDDGILCRSEVTYAGEYPHFNVDTPRQFEIFGVKYTIYNVTSYKILNDYSNKRVNGQKFVVITDGNITSVRISKGADSYRLMYQEGNTTLIESSIVPFNKFKLERNTITITEETTATGLNVTIKRRNKLTIRDMEFSYNPTTGYIMKHIVVSKNSPYKPYIISYDENGCATEITIMDSERQQRTDMRRQDGKLIVTTTNTKYTHR